MNNHKCSHCGSHAHTTVLSTLLYGEAEICTSCRLNQRVLYRRIRKTEDGWIDRDRAILRHDYTPL